MNSKLLIRCLHNAIDHQHQNSPFKLKGNDLYWDYFKHFKKKISKKWLQRLIFYMLIKLVNEQFFHILCVHLFNTIYLISLLESPCCYCLSLEDVRILLSRFMRKIPVGRFVFVFIKFTEIPQCQLHWDLKRSAQPHAGLLEVGKNIQILFVMSSKFIHL